MGTDLAERQRQWRERQEAEGKKQLMAMVSLEVHEAIRRIRQATGESKAAVIERAILALEKPADLFSPAEPSPKEPPTTERDQILSLIKKLREDGLSYRLVAEQLNEREIPTLSGKGQWHAKTVQKICKK